MSRRHFERMRRAAAASVVACGALLCAPTAGVAADATTTAGAESIAFLLLSVPALVLVVIAVRLTGFPKRSRRRREASGVEDSPMSARRTLTGARQAAKPSDASPTPSSPEPGRRREVATAVGNAKTPEPAAADAPDRPGPDTGPKGVRAVGYATWPKSESADDACTRQQFAAIDAFCRERGWRLLELVRDLEDPGVRGPDRPGLRYALERVAKGEASCLVVSELSRLSASASDLGRIVESIVSTDGWLVAIDVGLDTGLPTGRQAANVLISVGASQRERVRERTRSGLEAARARGRRIGRSGVMDVPELKTRIAAMRAGGMTLQAIADRLNEEGTPTLRGGLKWRPSSVQAAARFRRPPGQPEDDAGSTPAEGQA